MNNHSENHQNDSIKLNSQYDGDKEKYYRMITDNTPVMIWITNPEGNCTYLNKQWYDYTGQSPESGLGVGWLEAVHPDDKDNSTNIFLNANNNYIPFKLEYRLKNKSGEYRWHLDSGLPKFNDQGEFEGFIGSVVDIHERKLAEESLIESESWYKNYAEAMPQMAFIADPNGNIIYYNQRWYEYIEDISGTEGWGWKEKDIHHPDDLQKTIERWKYSLDTGEPYEIEYRLRRHDGKYRWHLGRAMPIRNNLGNIKLWIGTNTDIHNQKKIEESLKQTKERFQLMAMATNDAIWDWDFNINKLWWNDNAFLIFGYKKEEISEQVDWWSDRIHPDDRSRILSGLRSVIHSAETFWSDEYRFKCANNSYVEILDRGYIIRNEEGKPVRMVGSMLNISERKEVEEALLFEREKLKAIIENMGVGVGMTDEKGSTLSLNKEALRIHDFDTEEDMLSLISQYRDIFEIQYPDGSEMPFEEWPSMRAIKGNKVVNYEVKLINHKTKNQKYISYTAVPLYDSKGSVMNFIFTLNDLTERKKVEEEIKYQKSLLESQQEVSPLGKLVVSPEGKMLTFNKRMAEMWKFPNEIMDTKLDEVALKSAQDQLIDPEGFIKKVKECYQERLFNREKLYFKDGRIFERFGSPVTDNDGKYYGYVWFFMDITVQENLARQKDEFLGIASHELKTPVAIMKGYINLAERFLRNKNDTMEADLLKKADVQISRLTNLINDLLDVTKIESGKMVFENEEFDFDTTVDEVVESMRQLSSHNLVNIGTTNKKVIGDKDRTGQVIVNIISNAVKYSPKNTEITITKWSNGYDVLLSIKDNGVGISKENLNKIFDRFFRVRSEGNISTGLGLGLYISSEIIKRQNGKIWVESKEGEGSTFIFSLPTAGR